MKFISSWLALLIVLLAMVASLYAMEKTEGSDEEDESTHNRHITISEPYSARNININIMGADPEDSEGKKKIEEIWRLVCQMYRPDPEETENDVKNT